MCLCAHVEALLGLPAHQIAKLLAFVVVDVDPVISDDPAFRPFHQFERLSRLAGAGGCHNDDSLAADINAGAVYGVGIPGLFQDGGSHSECPALALSIIFCVEEQGFLGLGAVVRGGFEAFHSYRRNDP